MGLWARLRQRGPAESQWALEALRKLQLPVVETTEELITVFAQRVERPVFVAPTHEPIINGALEEWSGGLAIRVPEVVSEGHRTRLICRGLARLLYGEPGSRVGHPDYSTPVEREIEEAAGYLDRHLVECAVYRADVLGLEGRRVTLSPR